MSCPSDGPPVFHVKSFSGGARGEPLVFHVKSLTENIEIRRSLERLSERFELDDDQQARLARVISALARDDFAPTTVSEPKRAVDVHLADSLVALELELVREA